MNKLEAFSRGKANMKQIDGKKEKKKKKGTNRWAYKEDREKGKRKKNGKKWQESFIYSLGTMLYWKRL